MSNIGKSYFYLILVTVFWGATFPLLHAAIKYVHPDVIVMIRFACASLILLPFVISAFKKTNKNILMTGIALGLLNGGTFIFQGIGLETVSASRAAFITGASILFVPFLAALFKLNKLKLKDIICVLICMLGLYILTGANLSDVSYGDLWILACAICVALTIIVIQKATIHSSSYGLLTFYQFLFTAPIAASVGFLHSTNWSNLLVPDVLITVIFCTIFATIIALYLQMKYQHYLSATKVALIFALEPVFASLFSWSFTSARMTSAALIGGSLILLSIILPDTLGLLLKLKPDIPII